MPIVEAFSGSATISTTEYSLPNASTTLTPRGEDGVYQAFVDLAALAAGDEYELRVYERARSASTQRRAVTAFCIGVQTGLFVTPSLILLHGWDITLRRLAGTDRSIEWSIRQVT